MTGHISPLYHGSEQTPRSIFHNVYSRTLVLSFSKFLSSFVRVKRGLEA